MPILGEDNALVLLITLSVTVGFEVRNIDAIRLEIPSKRVSTCTGHKHCLSEYDSERFSKSDLMKWVQTVLTHAISNTANCIFQSNIQGMA